ncbi:hypothetical protein [Pseudofulvibacter geojedonensis]|uniref:UDP-glycosyltransferase n=1 Tax=Pseudofulvibacter geojedonensis TaxID=1123758 RepID=A0ABW3HYK7_9FLAO
MKRLGVVIADGVGYRNFILSDFLKEASALNDEVVIYSGLLKSVYHHQDIPNNVTIKELKIYRETSFTWLYRKLKEVAHMQLHKKHFGIKCSLENGYPKKLKSKRDYLTLLVYWLTTVFKSESWIKRYENWQYKTYTSNNTYREYLSVIKENIPSHIFFSHQRPANLAPFLAAAKACNIPSSSFIFSWDNLASKGRMLGDFDSYFVWSDLMKKELLHFYPSVKSEKVTIVGTPQFEPYVLEAYKKNKEYYHEYFNLDKDKKTIYYSCGDKSTSRLDPLYIKTIAEAIKNNKIKEEVNLIVRTSPAEDETRFLDLIDEYPFIKWNFPDWPLTRTDHPETWSQRVPSFKDLCDLRALLAYSDININMCSTMSLDFILFDKPVINAVFGNKENGLYNDQKYLKYVHYSHVIDTKGVVVAKNEDDLITAINLELASPEKNKVNRDKILALEIGKPLKGTSKRIVEALNQI